MPPKANPLTRYMMAIAYFIAAFFLLSHCDLFTVLFLIAWGPFVLVLMRTGINSAPRENWNRQTTSIGSVFVFGAILCIMFCPCIWVVYRFDAVTGFAAAGLVLVTKRLMIPLLNKWLGSIHNLNIDEPSDARKSPVGREFES